MPSPFRILLAVSFWALGATLVSAAPEEKSDSFWPATDKAADAVLDRSLDDSPTAG